MINIFDKICFKNEVIFYILIYKMNDIIPIIGKYFIELKYTKFKDFVNQDNIYWQELSHNRNAIPFLEQNMDKIHWNELSSNSNIFTYDKENLQEQFQKLTILSKIFIIQIFLIILLIFQIVPVNFLYHK